MPLSRSKEAVAVRERQKDDMVQIGDKKCCRGKQAEKDGGQDALLRLQGVDYLAEEIMRLAREAGIPLVSNPPLARTLYAACDAGEEILAEHYQAVAEVISYVWKLKGKRAA